MNSTVRQVYADRFGPSVDLRSNRYIWYGTKSLFHGLTLTFRETDAVSSRHIHTNSTKRPALSLLNVTIKRGRQPDSTILMMNKPGRILGSFQRGSEWGGVAFKQFKWIQFALVKNSTWFFENVVLLGDALHTAHFSIGSGTKLALEDALALTDCFMQASLVQKALQDFATSRRLSSRIIRLRPSVWFGLKTLESTCT